ncbi:unnamed protein product [Diamesa serratosioi]
MKSLLMIVIIVVALFGLSSAQDEEQRSSILNTFTSSIIERVLDSKRVDEDGDNRGLFLNTFLNRPSNGPSKFNLLGLQGANKVQLFKKKVQTTIKPTQYVKFPRISSTIEKFKQQSKPQLSPIIPQIAPQYQDNQQYYNHFQQSAPVLPYF